jgi:hypothetical protein
MVRKLRAIFDPRSSRSLPHFLYIKEKKKKIEAYYPQKKIILPSFFKKMHICKLLCKNAFEEKNVLRRSEEEQ